MNFLTKDIEDLIVAHSLEEYPDECCGIVLNHNDQYEAIKCQNVSSNKKENFRISPEEYLRAQKKGKIVAYYHSHPDDDEGVFSDADKKVSHGHGLPLIMFCVRRNKFFEYKDY